MPKQTIEQLEARVITLCQEIEVQERQNENIEKFIQKANKLERLIRICSLGVYSLALMSFFFRSGSGKNNCQSR